MKISVFLFFDLIIFITNSINDFDLRNSFLDILKEDINESTKNAILNSLRDFLNENFEYFHNIDDSKKDVAFKKCTNKLFYKTNNIYNYLYLFSYSGKEFFDLGLKSDCIANGFDYYVLSFNYNISSDKENKIYEFLEQDKFYIGLCLLTECNDLIGLLFHENSFFLGNLYNSTIIEIINKDRKDVYENDEITSAPYITLNELGHYDRRLTKKEKVKFNIFYILFIITMIFLGFEIIFGIFINWGYYLYNNRNNKILTKELNIENEKDEEDEDYTKEGNVEQNIFLNNPSQKDEETKTQKIINIIFKYFSLFTNIIILIIKKNKYYNNKNMRTIAKLRTICLLLITFSANFDVLMKISSKVFYDDSFYKEIYFIFFKFASFGIDIYICLDGFETIYKLMNYFKKNYYDKGNKTINFLGILKFYLYSVYKIIGFIIIFFIVNIFNRYYIYIHNSDNTEGLYFYYSYKLINKRNIFGIFNLKYTFLSYFFPRDKNSEEFIYNMKMPLLFINEFYIFTLFIIIFYIGNILKSKIYDYSLLIFVLISYFFTYFICLYSNSDNELYTYKKITRNILLIKYPHILFNHFLLGVFTGLICFYLKDSNNNNSIADDKEKSPFQYCLNFAELFDYLIQKGRKIWIFSCLLIQIMICSTFTLLLYLNKKKNIDNLSLDFILSLKIIYYYESGLFIFIFCFIIVLLYSYENESKIISNYNILYLINRISFSYTNTIYIMTYSYYNLFGFQLKLTYQNLWLITFGIFIFFCIENILITIAFIMPFKIIFKTIIDKHIILNKKSFQLDDRNNNIINNNTINNYNDDGYDSD